MPQFSSVPLIRITPPTLLPRALQRHHFSNVPFCALIPFSPDNDDDEVDRYARLLQRCARTFDLLLGSAIHAHVAKSPLLCSSLYLQNHLLNMYFKCCGGPSVPLKLFDQMPRRNVVTWSATIASLAQSHHPERALLFFREMRRECVNPNEFSLVSALNASSLSDGCAGARQIYAQVIQLGFESNVFLMNAYLMSLIRNGKLEEAWEVFEKYTGKDVVSWNSMLAGLLQFPSDKIWELWCRMNREGVKPDEFSFSSVLTGLAAAPSLSSGVQVHAQLVKYGHGPDVCVGNSLIDMYFKNRDLSSSFKAFGGMQNRDVVSWTQMAAACLLCGQPSEALRTIDQMKLAGVQPNKFTLATALNACSTLASLEEGKKHHGFRVKLGEDVDECVDNALIDMYARCGSTNSAWEVFCSMKEWSVISWTTMIMGFAQNGLAQEALQVFNKMIDEKMKPNCITFICVLYACSQGGFVEEGRKYLDSMTRDHGVEPGEDHYACMVDLLGKTGHTADAEALILSTPFRTSVLLWQTLLGACKLHGDVKTGKRAAEQALGLEKEDPSTYLLLSNMLANTNNWNAVGRVRELMDDREVRKMPGSSWIGTRKVSGSLELSQH